MSVGAPVARIGFVGLGNLGQPMARALVRAGWSVAVLDAASEKAEPCVAEDARAAAGPGELAGCAVVALARSGRQRRPPRRSVRRGSAPKLANQCMMFRHRESSKQIPVTLLEHLITINNLAERSG